MGRKKGSRRCEMCGVMYPSYYYRTQGGKARICTDCRFSLYLDKREKENG